MYYKKQELLYQIQILNVINKHYLRTDYET